MDEPPTRGSPMYDTGDKMADPPDTRSQLEKVEQMLIDLNLLDLLKEDGAMNASTEQSVRRNDLFQVLKVAYNALLIEANRSSIPAQDVSSDTDILTKLCKHQDERFDKFREELQRTVHQTIQQLRPSYAQLARDSSSPVTTPAPSIPTATPAATPSTTPQPKTSWRKIVIDCNEGDIDKVHKLSETALSKTKVSRLVKKKNAVIITVPSTDGDKAADALKDLASKTVKVRSEPTCKITVLNFPLTDSIRQATDRPTKCQEILKSLKEKNEQLDNDNIDVIYYKVNVRDPDQVPDTCTIGLRLPTVIKRQILGQGVVYVGYMACRVVDRVRVIQCYNCQDFHHTQDVCKKRAVCTHCSQEHPSSECKAKSNDNFIPKCTNCSVAKKSDVAHTANSRDCPLYLSKFNEARSKNQ